MTIGIKRERKIMNRMNELPEEYQTVLNHLINHIASHPPMYRENAIKRLEPIIRENPYQDDIPGLDRELLLNQIRATDEAHRRSPAAVRFRSLMSKYSQATRKSK